MKILELHVEGFRSLKNVTWKPGDLNVVIGPNASGKSNLLKALEMLSVAAEGRLGPYVQSSGGMGSLLWDGSSKQISLSVVVAADDNPFIEIGEGDPYLFYDLSLARIQHGYWIMNETLVENEVAEDDSIVPIKTLTRKMSKATILGNNGNETEIAAPSDFASDEAVISLARRPYVMRQSANSLRRVLSDCHVYTCLDVRTDSPVRQAPVTRNETQVEVSGLNLINVLHTLYTSNRDFKNDVNRAMSAAFGADYDELVFPPADDQRIQLRVRWKSLKRELSAADLSDGMLRFLYLISILANPEQRSLIAIDEPEIGLHPNMLPIIAEFAVAASKRTQVILTTHSAQLLDAFKVTDTLPTITVALWEDGETKLTTLEAAELQRWLDQYTLGALYNSGTLEAIA